MTLGHVRVDLDGASARFRALLAGDTFDVLQRALMGARYDRQAGASVAPLPLVQDILDRLRKADFDVTCTDEVLGALDKRRDEDWLERHNVEERVESIGEEMHARTGHTYYPFQRTGILWLALRHGGLLADDMGLGKTIQAITSLPANSPALVVAPVNAKGVWRDEVKKWRPQLRVSVLEGRESFRWPRPGELVSTNYDVLPKVCLPPCDGLLPAERCRGCGAPDFEFDYDTRPGVDPLASLLRTARSAPRSHRPDCDGWRSRRPCPGCAPLLKKAAEGTVLIFDEMHRIKNKKAQRTIRAAALARAVRRGTGRTWGLTGTPLENTPPEL